MIILMDEYDDNKNNNNNNDNDNNNDNNPGSTYSSLGEFA